MRIISDKIMAAILVAALLAALPVIAGCTSGESREVEIIPENSYWSPAMSSVIGIGLSVDYSGDENVKYEWSADYGGFLLWNNEVVSCDPPCISNTPVWWTYMTNVTNESIHSALDLPEEVNIVVNVINRSDGEGLAQSSLILKRDETGGYSVNLTW